MAVIIIAGGAEEGRATDELIDAAAEGELLLLKVAGQRQMSGRGVGHCISTT